ncbi:SPOR domain-containing protein [Phenylobacterium immobile]|uniref:cell division protein FtsN n=1 Tax=Phenylobacterium immobile TaxID=21 RepID=UPI000A518A2D|nr:SPOR domain-containing protein [Phenylobacterium immobile]
MSDHDRGAYTPPTEAPLAFDPRQQPRGGGQIPWAMVLSLLVLGALAAAIFIFYQSGVRQQGQAPQTVGAPVGDIRSAAPPEAQTPDPAEGLQIYRSEPGQPGEAAPAQPNFVPPPEAPQARPTAPVAMNALPPVAAAAPPPKTVVPPLPKPAPPKVVTPAPKVATAPVAAPKAVAPATAPKPASAPATVQIGAFSSQSLADKGWSDAAAIAPGAAAGKGKRVERVEREDGSTLFRTSVTGFASREDAQAFCGQLKAAGKTCFVR